MSIVRLVTYIGLAFGAGGGALFVMPWPWALLVAAGVFVLLQAFPSLRREFIRSRRSARGQCPNCGYDLTGIRGICMQCASDVTRADRERREAGRVIEGKPDGAASGAARSG